MKTDKYGQIILTVDEVCNLYLQDPSRKLNRCILDEEVKFSPDLDIQNPPDITAWIDQTISIEEFDKNNQSVWYMPDEYKELDIAKWILDQCTTDEQRQRVGEELLLYLERDLFPLLQYLKYLVDTMRKYNIVWGVGRGSSVSSYVLYLLGVHRIDSMYYGLDVHEFLR